MKNKKDNQTENLLVEITAFTLAIGIAYLLIKIIF